MRRQRATLPAIGAILLALLSLLVATACGGAATPGATPTTPAAPTPFVATPTAAPFASAPTATVAPPRPTLAPSPIAPSATTRPATTPAATPAASSPAQPAAPIAGPWPVPPHIEREVAAFFDAFYRARTLPRGGAFDLDAVRALTAAPYRHHTLSLLERDAADAAAGRLLEARYSGLGVIVDKWEPRPEGSGDATVTVTRTLHETRADGPRPPQTATLRFQLRRELVGANGMAWAARDFFDPDADAWVSQGSSFGARPIDAELADFFREFYAARAVRPGEPFSVDIALAQTNFAYSAYARPLLERQREEAATGALTSVTYGDIAVALVAWDPNASDHGGMATVRVTRTLRVVRPGGAEPPQTATVQFRLHRHLDDNYRDNTNPAIRARDAQGSAAGGGRWFAIDFLDPAAGRWVSEGNAQSPGPLPAWDPG